MADFLSSSSSQLFSEPVCGRGIFSASRGDRSSHLEIAREAVLFALCILLCGLPHWWTREGDSSALPQLSFSEAASGSRYGSFLSTFLQCFLELLGRRRESVGS